MEAEFLLQLAEVMVPLPGSSSARRPSRLAVPIRTPISTRPPALPARPQSLTATELELCTGGASASGAHLSDQQDATDFGRGDGIPGNENEDQLGRRREGKEADSAEGRDSSACSSSSSGAGVEQRAADRLRTEGSLGEDKRPPGHRSAVSEPVGADSAEDSGSSSSGVDKDQLLALLEALQEADDLCRLAEASTTHQGVRSQKSAVNPETLKLRCGDTVPGDAPRCSAAAERSQSRPDPAHARCDLSSLLSPELSHTSPADSTPIDTTRERGDGSLRGLTAPTDSVGPWGADSIDASREQASASGQPLLTGDEQVVLPPSEASDDVRVSAAEPEQQRRLPHNPIRPRGRTVDVEIASCAWDGATVAGAAATGHQGEEPVTSVSGSGSVRPGEAGACGPDAGDAASTTTTQESVQPVVPQPQCALFLTMPQATDTVTGAVAGTGSMRMPPELLAQPSTLLPMSVSTPQAQVTASVWLPSPELPYTSAVSLSTPQPQATATAIDSMWLPSAQLPHPSTLPMYQRFSPASASLAGASHRCAPDRHVPGSRADSCLVHALGGRRILRHQLRGGTLFCCRQCFAK